MDIDSITILKVTTNIVKYQFTFKQILNNASKNPKINQLSFNKIIIKP